MTEKPGWFQRPLASCCLLAVIAVMSVFALINSGEGRESGGDITYRITIRHYGVDAGEMEKSTAIPLEDALSAIPGADRILTISENSRVRAFVTFPPRRRFPAKNDNDRYDAVREAAQRVYETLPPSAQRPELGSSGNSQVPFWTAAVYSATVYSTAVYSSADSANSIAGSLNRNFTPSGALLEQTIKPALASIEGIAEVEIAGPGIREILILMDHDKIASLGLSLSGISGALAANDALFPAGAMLCNGSEIPIYMDARYRDTNALGEALIPLENGHVRLKTLGEIKELERDGDSISRLNGKKTAIISVTAVSGADTRILSKRIKKELDKLAGLDLEIHILEDRGAEEAAAFRSVLIAALQASVLVAFSMILLGWGKSAGPKNALICSIVIPLILIISAALLSAASFMINRKFLAGLAIGVGCAVDAVILSAEGFGFGKKSTNDNRITGRNSAKYTDEPPHIMLHRVWPPIISGGATTIAAILPLLALTTNADITVIACALGIVTIVSAFLALTLLPPLFLRRKEPDKNTELFSFPARKFNLFFTFAPDLIKKTKRHYSRFLANIVRICKRQPLFIPVLSLVISAAAVLCLVLSGADIAGEQTEDSIYVQIEFEGGLLKEEADTHLAAWAEALCEHSAVKEVQTIARTGSGNALITFDPQKIKINNLRELVRSKTIKGAFVYIPEPSREDRIYTITVSGDDAEKCRELARMAAALCSTEPGSIEQISAGQSSGGQFKETVLNFKQGGPKFTLYPRRESLAQAGVYFSHTADTVRRGIHGPVAYKRNENGRDIDVRMKFHETLGGDGILKIPISAGNAAETISIGSITEAVRTQDISAIQRENRRRIASISVRTGPGDPRIIRSRIMETLKNLELPPGYKIEFDREAIRQAEALSGKILNFLFALIFCYMIMAATEESFILPLIILASVPPSLAIPVMVLAVTGTPVNTAVACALIAVSGMTVNASVISAGALIRGLRETTTDTTGADTGGKRESFSVYRILKSRLPVLLAATGTTIAGGLPFLFLKEGNNALIKTLALVTVLGVGTSFFCSITLIPSLINIYLPHRKSGSAWRDLKVNKEFQNET